MAALSLFFLLASSYTWASAVLPRAASPDALAACPGYTATNVRTTSTGLTADLSLAGQACNVYGTDLAHLVLQVTYEDDNRLHVKIQDVEDVVYQVPESVFPRPGINIHARESKLAFDYTASPFSFRVKRVSTGEVLFDTSAASIIFESQYLRLRTKLPPNPNLYGLGEHSDPFKLNSTSYIRTLWSQDAYGVPTGANLYGNHPVYYEHRSTGSHGVLFLNSNGMDIKIDNNAKDGQFLEYNTLGGVLDFYFLNGPSPVDVARQYSEIAGLPAMMPYWAFGFHNCRYGYQDAFAVAEAVYNYSKAGIPLETMWTDIDYMDARKVFTVDPQRFPLSMMQDLVHYLHSKDQHYVLMVDPAVAYQEYPAFQNGVSADIFLKRPDNGSIWQGVVWPGVTAFPDWFAPNIESYWNNEFATFFSPSSGVDIDALWIDMNEPSNFPCNFPCDNPYGSAVGFPPVPPAVRPIPRPLPGFPCSFQPVGTPCTSKVRRNIVEPGPRIATRTHEIEQRQAPGKELGLPGRDLLYPKYAIHNAAGYTVEANAAGGGISNHTINTDVIHHNGLAMYDTHNLYGTMMSTASQKALLNRRPGLRPLVITRSTFAGAGAKVGHWLGDNMSTWTHYRQVIKSMMAFASIYQVPMVGADVCGFASNTNEQLCARWAMLGAFSPFYRVHNAEPPTIAQEFYQWPVVTAAGIKAIDIRYRLLDYIYTALYQQTKDGTPLINPLFYLYPEDSNTFAIEQQYFYGPGIMVSPVTEEDSTSVSIYLPDDIYYDLWTYKATKGKKNYVTLTGVGLTDIPLHILGGNVIPMRVSGGMTTTEVRQKDFDLVIAPGQHGQATGDLYLDDGVSIVQAGITSIHFHYLNGEFYTKGKYGYKTPVKVATVTILGVSEPPKGTKIDGVDAQGTFDKEKGTWTIKVDKPLTGDFTLSIN